jgi:hypothetical protein
VNNYHCATCRLFMAPDDAALAYWASFARRHQGVGECPGFCPRTFSRENGEIRPARAGDPVCDGYEAGMSASPPQAPAKPRQPDLLGTDWG